MTEFTPVNEYRIKEHTPPRERLTDEEMVNLLSAFGNNEAQALTLLIMKPGIIYGGSKLSGDLIKAQGENPEWRISRPLTFIYCEKSLFPIGLVATEVIDQLNRRYGYVKTKYGETLGGPLAVLLLDFSLRHPSISLYTLLGATASPSKVSEFEGREGEMLLYKKRAIGTRLKIFLELLTDQLPIREIDLTEAVGEEHGIISGHLKQLDAYGIVNLDSRGVKENYVVYKLAPSTHDLTKPILQRGDITMTDLVYEIMSANPEKYWTIQEVISSVKGKLADTPKAELMLQGRVNHALSILRTLDILESKDFTGRSQSRIDLTPEQKAILYDFLSLVMRFQDQDPDLIKEAHSRISSFSSEEISELMAKAKENSPYAGSPSRSAKESEILSVIQNNPGITKREIYEHLEGIRPRISFATLESIIKELTRSGQVYIDSEKKAGKNRMYVQ